MHPSTEDTAVTDRPFPALQTERLELREITMDDAEWFLAHFSTPEIVYGQGFAAPADIGAAREQLAQYIVDLFANGDGLRWGIKLKGQDGSSARPASTTGTARSARRNWATTSCPRAGGRAS